MSLSALDHSYKEVTEMALNGFDNQEEIQLIAELMQGWNLTKQLQAQMGPQLPGKTERILLDGILASFASSLRLLKWDRSMEQLHHHVVPCSNMPESPISAIGSPMSNDLNMTQQDTTDFPKKRKMTSTWKKQEKVSAENGAEPNDGYSWRKYGQKDILGAKHPRSYYRCTYRNMQSCFAIKQVQRSDEDPSVFDITYKGRHTCIILPRSKSAPTSPEKRGPKKQPEFPTMDYPQQQPNTLFDFRTGLNIDTQNLDNQEMGFPHSGSESGYDNHPFLQSTHIDNNYYNSFSPSFVLSPATSESTYFSTSPCKISTFGGAHSGQNTESDITDLISATTSRTNSPIISTDFPLEQLEFNPCFPYDSQSFFPSFSQAKE